MRKEKSDSLNFCSQPQQLGRVSAVTGGDFQKGSHTEGLLQEVIAAQSLTEQQTLLECGCASSAVRSMEQLCPHCQCHMEPRRGTVSSVPVLPCSQRPRAAFSCFSIRVPSPLPSDRWRRHFRLNFAFTLLQRLCKAPSCSYCCGTCTHRVAREVPEGISLHCITSHLNTLHLSLSQNSPFAHRTAISCQSWALALCFARCDGQRDSTTSPFPEIEMDPVLPTSLRLSTAPAGPPRLPATATGVLPALQPHHTAYIWRIPLPHPSECNYTHGCGPLLMGKPPHTLQATNSIKETQFSLVVPHLVPQKALLMQRAVYFSLLDLN